VIVKKYVIYPVLVKQGVKTNSEIILKSVQTITLL